MSMRYCKTSLETRCLMRYGELGRCWQEIRVTPRVRAWEMVSTVVAVENPPVRREVVCDGGYRNVDFVVMIHSHGNAS